MKTPVLVRTGVSTHSRPKAAGSRLRACASSWLFQHTAARRRLASSIVCNIGACSFNTQPPEGGCLQIYTKCNFHRVSTHSRPKAAVIFSHRHLNRFWFQHTAARRRLNVLKPQKHQKNSFNTQPPEGG